MYVKEPTVPFTQKNLEQIYSTCSNPADRKSIPLVIKNVVIFRLGIHIVIPYSVYRTIKTSPVILISNVIFFLICDYSMNTVAVIVVVLFGLGVLISTSMTTTADGQPVVDREKINKQLEQVVKALDSGDIAAAVEYLKETAQGLPDGEAKTHLSVAIDALKYSNDTKAPRMHVQLVEGSLQNSTG